MIITAGGIRLLEKISRSCRPTMANGGEKGKAVLAVLSKKTKDVDYAHLRGKIKTIEGLYNIFDHILDFTERQGYVEINEYVIARFFGGEPHSNRIEEYIKEENLGKLRSRTFARNYYITHILMAARAIKCEDNLCDFEYLNNGVCLMIKNLVPFDGVKVKKSQYYLIHHASILAPANPPRIANLLMDIQKDNGHFIKACKDVKGGSIDQKLTPYFEWAKKAGKEKN